MRVSKRNPKVYNTICLGSPESLKNFNNYQIWSELHGTMGLLGDRACRESYQRRRRPEEMETPAAGSSLVKLGRKNRGRGNWKDQGSRRESCENR